MPCHERSGRSDPRTASVGLIGAGVAARRAIARRVPAATAGAGPSCQQLGQRRLSPIDAVLALSTTTARSPRALLAAVWRQAESRGWTRGRRRAGGDRRSARSGPRAAHRWRRRRRRRLDVGEGLRNACVLRGARPQAARGYVEYDPDTGVHAAARSGDRADRRGQPRLYAGRLPDRARLGARLAAHRRGRAQRRGRRLARSRPRRARGVRALLPPRLQRQPGLGLAAGARRRRRQARRRARPLPTSAAGTARPPS